MHMTPPWFRISRPGHRRSRLSTAALVLALAVAGVAASSNDARACSCRELSPAEAREGADAVFEGRVEAISASESSGVGPAPMHVTLRVVRTWKGVDQERVVVRTASSGAMCGYPFEPNRSYLVYAHRTDDHGLRTGLCDRTQPIEEAGEDLDELGAGITPVEPSADSNGEKSEGSQAASATGANARTSSQAGCGSCSTGTSQDFGAPLVGVTLLLAGLVYRRRGR